MLPLHQRPAWLRVMIVRPMRLPDRGFITTEAGRDSNGFDFLRVPNHQMPHSCPPAGVGPAAPGLGNRRSIR